MALLANMVTHNEADRYLVEVLAHLSTFADEIVITDDASNDATADIAESMGAHVFRNTENLFTINEGKLRQMAWDNLSQYAKPGDWILCIDADEMLYGLANLPRLMNQSRFDVLGITFYHMWNPFQYRADKAWKPNLSSRLFRYYVGGTFPQRKLASGSEPEYVKELIRQRRAYWDTGLRMQHLGYLKDEDKKMKYDRYMSLDHGNFHSLAHIESIIDPNPTLLPWVD